MDNFVPSRGGTPPPIPSAGKTLICLGQMTFTNFYNFLDTDSNDFLDILYNEEGPQVGQKYTENDTSSLLWICSEDFLKNLYDKKDKELNQNCFFQKKMFGPIAPFWMQSEDF